jgi:hypothetical protein
MTKFDGAVDEDKGQLGRGKNPREPMAPSRWINPILGVLGTLVLSGYLMTSHPSTPAATAPAQLSDERLAPAHSQETGSLGHSAVAENVATLSSITDLMKTAFGAVLALVWAVCGAWLGMHRARAANSLDEPADHMRITDYPTRTAYNSLRAPTCERMYDETRLVPQYLRSVQFPATKQGLLPLAKEHTDEGSALRRLDCIPDRRYSSLHDLISEIHVD